MGIFLRAHCTCMANIGPTWSNLQPVLCRSSYEAGTDKPSMYEKKTCEWLPNGKNINPIKIKDIHQNRQDFRKRGKTVKRFLTTPEKNYDPLVQPQKRPLDFHDFTDKLNDLIPGGVSYTAVSKTKADFVRETLSTNETKSELLNINDYLVSSRTCDKFTNIKENFCSRVISEIETGKRGQSDNSVWFSFRKGIIIASKFHYVITKMKKVVSVWGVVNLWSSFQKVLGSTYKNPTYLFSSMDEKWKGMLLKNLKKFFLGRSIKILALKSVFCFLKKPTPLLVWILTA